MRAEAQYRAAVPPLPERAEAVVVVCSKLRPETVRLCSGLGTDARDALVLVCGREPVPQELAASLRRMGASVVVPAKGGTGVDTAARRMG